ncbi:MAG: DUF503 domain-containing protein [Sandaracinaceae bacterium]
MIVATARLTLALPGNRSLKDKRRVLRKILDRVRHRFNAAIAEVADMDVHQRAVIGLAVVSNDASHASSMLDTLVSFVASSGEAVLTDRRTELVPIGDGEHMDALGSDPSRRWNDPEWERSWSGDGSESEDE